MCHYKCSLYLRYKCSLNYRKYAIINRMNAIKKLIVFCLIVILITFTVKIIMIGLDMKSDEQTQITGSVPVSNKNFTPEVDPKILINDDEKPIVIPKAKKVVPKPYISAESYLVANLVTGEKYIDFNSNKVFPIASVSKLYTALVVHHLFDLNKGIVITQSILDSYGDAGHLMLGEKFLPDELLNVLLLESSNDAAEAFSESYDISTTSKKFIEQMNGFAQEIGMNNTHFSDPSGLSSLNVSNVDDLFVLAQYLNRSEKEILAISRTKEIDIATTTDHGSHHLVNINPFSNYPSFIGGKTGRTNEAKEAMVSLFNQKVGNIEYPIAVIILRSNLGEREINTEKLLGMFMDKMIKK